jgi:hypothetical protein
MTEFMGWTIKTKIMTATRTIIYLATKAGALPGLTAWTMEQMKTLIAAREAK